MRDSGNVYILCTHIQEERFVFMCNDKIFGFSGNDICNIFIHPKSRFATGHPTDTGDTVDNGIIMSLAGFHFYQFRIFKPCRPVAHFVLVADSNGILGIKSYNMGIFYEHTRNPVYCGRNDKFIVEAYVLSIRPDFAIEVRATFRT